jgi:hypothetical protein
MEEMLLSNIPEKAHVKNVKGMDLKILKVFITVMLVKVKDMS